MRSKAPLALMEQMVMLLVFALAAALCLQAFVKSDAISSRDEDRDRAVTLCQSVAEAVQHYHGDVEEAVNTVVGLSPAYHVPSVVSSNFDYCYVSLDKSWNPVEAGSAQGNYTLQIDVPAPLLSPDVPGLGQTKVRVLSGEETLFELTFAWQEVSEGG